MISFPDVRSGKAWNWVRAHWEPVILLYVIALYVLLTVEQLASFPVYFFCDEAMLGVDAHSLLTKGVDSHGVRWPLFFQELGFYSHSISVYLNMPSIMLFGLTEFAVRFTTVLSSVVGVLAAYGTLRYLFHLKTAWVAVPLFLISPVWFLHSRTGFEYVMAASFFLAFAFFYVLAFSRDWRYVFPAALFGAATFYAHTTGRGWMLIACILLFFVNIPVHFRHWRRVIIGLVLLLVLLSPYIYLHLTSPDIAMKRLEMMDAYHGTSGQPFSQRVFRILENYAFGVNPLFWYTWEHTQNDGPMQRHVIPKLPLVPAWTFPFALVGFGMLFWPFDLRRRTLLALFAAAPVPAALVEFNIHRGITVGVFLIVFASLGLGWIVWALRRWPRMYVVIVGILLVGSTAYALWFRHHVHRVAPYQYANHGFYGTQMGAPQVFGWIKDHHGDYEQVVLSHALFNAGNIFIPFYLSDEIAAKARISDLDRMYKDNQEFPANAVYVARVEYLEKLQKLKIPIRSRIVDTIPDLNGRPLFHIFTVAGGPELAEGLSQFWEDRGRLATTEVTWKSQNLQVEHQPFDIGSVKSIFDGDPSTLARTEELNPAHVIVHLAPTRLRRIRVTTSHRHAVVTVATRSKEGGEETPWGSLAFPQKADESFETLEFSASPAVSVSVIDVKVDVRNADAFGHIHIHEIDWD